MAVNTKTSEGKKSFRLAVRINNFLTCNEYLLIGKKVNTDLSSEKTKAFN